MSDLSFSLYKMALSRFSSTFISPLYALFNMFCHISIYKPCRRHEFLQG
jgi:hypothetical protein